MCAWEVSSGGVLTETDAAPHRRHLFDADFTSTENLRDCGTVGLDEVHPEIRHHPALARQGDYQRQALPDPHLPRQLRCCRHR